ncbi:helix-turn-helix domain-containing protein [Subtercola boreus]|uniref:Helix-turn-helix domain-containing protein n=1 Tax=Subtercola boreus TaxID=120213 RepID=A0A3E0WGV0_9MICO|nr:helix-turn-helix domain-containing protein [Subtercola boreus]RFA23685.1 hypothetical protein B7R24_00255 [Subtercola boreus]RFA24077.1 hypothetical protein B7R23_00255 [Subtercola boreus]RFA29777.1 hypothetical protein B7R25_00250 [Subtercola boreus]
MPLLRERATGAVDAAAAGRLAQALANIPSADTDAASSPTPTRDSVGRLASVSVDETAIRVPTEVRDAVLDLLQRFADGQAVVVGSTDSLLTTSQAAELLGISATYLLRLANEGTLPVEYRGTHRRFRLADVMRYLESARAAKATKAAAAAADAAAKAPAAQADPEPTSS